MSQCTKCNGKGYVYTDAVLTLSVPYDPLPESPTYEDEIPVTTGYKCKACSGTGINPPTGDINSAPAG